MTITLDASDLAEAHRPPTPFGRQAPREVVEAGYDLARAAIGFRLEKVPFEEAVARLVVNADQQALRMARDYLALRHFPAPITARADALAVIDGVLHRREFGPARCGVAGRARRCPLFRLRPRFRALAMR